MQNVIPHNGIIGNPISAEEWNEALQISTGSEIVSMLDPLHHQLLKISEIDPNTTRDYSFANLEQKIFPKKITFATKHEGIELIKNASLCDIVCNRYANAIIHTLGSKRFSAIIDLMTQSFVSALGSALRIRFAELFPIYTSIGLHNVLHSNLWICMYYQIGYHILGDQKTQSDMSFFVRSFLRGNFPLQCKDSLVFLVQ